MVPRSLLLVPLLLLVSCGRPPAGEPETVRVVPIHAVAVEFSAQAIPVEVPAVVARRSEAALAFTVAGVVREVLVRAGDQVVSGQLLASLDLSEIDAQLEQARNAVDKARRDRDRAVELQERDVVSIELAQNAATGLAQAEAALRIAEFNRRHAVIVAPSAGRVLQRLVEPNEVVAANKVAVLFASDADGWIARAGVPARDAARLRPGQRAVVRTPGQPELAGEVVQLSAATDPVTRTTEVEVALAKVPEGLQSGSVVDLVIQPDDVPLRAVVPAEALVEGEGRSARVFVVSADGRSVQGVLVMVETLYNDRAYLATALPGGARIATSGAEFLRDGAGVEISP